MNTEFNIIRLEGQFHFELSHKLPFASDHFVNKINDLIQIDFQRVSQRSRDWPRYFQKDFSWKNYQLSLIVFVNNGNRPGKAIPFGHKPWGAFSVSTLSLQGISRSEWHVLGLTALKALLYQIYHRIFCIYWSCFLVTFC